MDSFKSQLVTRVIVSSGSLAALIAVVGAGRKWK